MWNGYAFGVCGSVSFGQGLANISKQGNVLDFDSGIKKLCKLVSYMCDDKQTNKQNHKCMVILNPNNSAVNFADKMSCSRLVCALMVGCTLINIASLKSTVSTTLPSLMQGVCH